MLCTVCANTIFLLTPGPTKKRENQSTHSVSSQTETFLKMPLVGGVLAWLASVDMSSQLALAIPNGNSFSILIKQLETDELQRSAPAYQVSVGTGDHAEMDH